MSRTNKNTAEAEASAVFKEKTVLLFVKSEEVKIGKPLTVLADFWSE